METLLFEKKVDASFLKKGFAIPVPAVDSVLKAVGAVLGRGSHATIDIYVGDIAYPAVLAHYGLKDPAKDIYQIWYNENSEICKKINECFGPGTDVELVEIWAVSHRHLAITEASKLKLFD